MGSDGEKPGFEFVRGVECGAPQHGSHAAPPHAKTDLKYLAKNRADQGLVPLSGRERMDGRADGAADVDVDAAGRGGGGRIVLCVEQRLEGPVGAALVRLL